MIVLVSNVPFDDLADVNTELEPYMSTYIYIFSAIIACVLECVL